jgi:hypothetical protein
MLDPCRHVPAADVESRGQLALLCAMSNHNLIRISRRIGTIVFETHCFVFP